MYQKNRCYIIANFGGPRDLTEVAPFLQSLLTDKEVIRSILPQFIHSLFFSWVAKRRARKIVHEYKSMGGCSPIYKDTEALVGQLQQSLSDPILAFHRYLPATHESFIQNVTKMNCEEICIFPMFPQFTYATTGSIAKWFSHHFPKQIVNKMRWIKSYAAHPAFVRAHQVQIHGFLQKMNLKQEETVLLFSAHGVPQVFIDKGDIYQDECHASFAHIMKGFPKALGKLCYQSKFGRGEWVKPYTIDVSKSIREWHEKRENVVFVPISFTSDHIETLCEIENEYMTVIREKGLRAFRVPALTLLPEWIEAIQILLQETNLCSNQMLIRK